MHNLFMGDFWFHYYSVLQEQRGTVRSGDGHGGSGAAHRTKQKICVKSQIFPKNNVSLGRFTTLSPRFVQNVWSPAYTSESEDIDASNLCYLQRILAICSDIPFNEFFDAHSIFCGFFDKILQKNLKKLVN